MNNGGARGVLEERTCLLARFISISTTEFSTTGVAAVKNKGRGKSLTGK